MKKPALLFCLLVGLLAADYQVNVGTDTLFKGCPAGHATSVVTSVTAYNVGSATDTAMIADSLKTGSVPGATSKRAYWGLRLHYGVSGSQHDTLDRFAWLSVINQNGMAKTLTIRFDSSKTKDTVLSTVCKVTRAIFRGRWSGDTFGLVAENAGACVPITETTQYTYSYVGVAQETILPRQRGAVENAGDIYARLPAGAHAGDLVYPGTTVRTCAVTSSTLDSGWSIGRVLNYQKTAGLATIRAVASYISPPGGGGGSGGNASLLQGLDTAAIKSRSLASGGTAANSALLQDLDTIALKSRSLASGATATNSALLQTLDTIAIQTRIRDSIAAHASTGNQSVSDILSLDKATGTPFDSVVYGGWFKSGTTKTLLDYTGTDGYVSRIWIALYATGSVTDCSSCTLAVYCDTETVASIKTCFSSFFMNHYSAFNPNDVAFFQNVYFQSNTDEAGLGTSAACLIPIPFKTSIRITLNGVPNPSTPAADSVLLWACCEGYSGVPITTWTDTRHLRVATLRDQRAPTDTVITLVNSGGTPGRMVGMWMLLDDTLTSNPPLVLEGNYNMYIDSSVTPQRASSGTEDWFGMGFYFAAHNALRPNAGPSAIDGQSFLGTQIYPGFGYEIGNTSIGVRPGYVEGHYRFHVRDKLTFTKGLRFTWTMADPGSSITGYSRVWSTVWYYTRD